MGLFEKLFPKKTAEAAVYTYFKTLGGYAPVYTSFEGGVYEMALTRACIHTFATHVSKLRPVVMGPNGRRMERMLQFQPNPWMDTKKYLYRLATIYKTENTAFIVPVCEDPEQLRLSGFYPILPSQAEIVERSGVPYVRFRFPTGDVGVMELDYTGILTQFQYRSDFFGERNGALRPTMELIHAQNQSIINGVKASASVRFLARLANVLKPETMKEERDRLVQDNLTSGNSGGVMIFDSKYADIKQIDSKPYIVDDKQAAQIRESVFDYGELIFTDQEIQEGETYEAAALLSDALEIGTFQMELYLRDESKGAALTSFRRNDKLLYYHRERLQGTYYIESVERTGKFTYTVTANNALALLDQSDHMGGIYTGQTVEELVAEICNIPYQVQTKFAKVKLYGWLPVATRRANLAQVLFAVGAQAKVDQIGTLRIEALWDGVSSAITPDRVFWGDKVRYEAQVTEVAVLEHQYIPGTEEIQLFEGTTQSGDVIQFQEPVHSLAASGFSLLEQGANYARVSAGTGTLTGKKYVHTTRDVRQAVTPGDVANVVEVKEATLVSLVNSAAVAERLAEYYKWIEAMEATVVYDGERPGDVIAFEHPFGGASVGCVKSASITIGGRLVAEEVTAIGYKPPSSDIVEIYDVRKLITTNDPIVVPDGVTKMRAVLISGGTAGQNGTDGEPGADGESAWCSAGDNGEFTSDSQGVGGAGGNKGLGGSGGKVYSVDIEVIPGQILSPNIGLSGVASDTSGEQGSPGSATTLTVGGVVYTSDDGSASPSGYMDLVTGEVFAASGLDGVDGGSGGKSASKSENAESGADVGENTGGKLSSGNKAGDDSKYGPWLYQSSSDDKRRITNELNNYSYKGYTSYRRTAGGGFSSSGSQKTIGYTHGNPIVAGTVYSEFLNYSVPSDATGTIAFANSSMKETQVIDQGYEDKQRVYQWSHSARRTYKRGRAESTYGNLGAGGGGAANGVNGSDATPTCEGGAGADAVTPETPDKIGTGGTGGSGGGGGGAGGNGYISVEGNDGDVAYSKYQSGMMGGPGGKFGKGSNGAPGGIILYYGEPKVIVSGPLKEKNNRQFLDRHGRRFTV